MLRVVPGATVLLITVRAGRVLINVFYYLSTKFLALKWKTNMHNVAPRDGCGLIDIYTKGLILALLYNIQ